MTISDSDLKKECQAAVDQMERDEFGPEWAKTVQDLVPAFFSLAIASASMGIAAQALKDAEVI